MDASRSTSRNLPWSARPAVPAAALFILGIISHPVMPDWPVVWLAAMALLAVGATARLWRDGVRCTCLALAIAMAGLAAAERAAFHYPANHISQFLADEPRLAWVEMRIADAPRLVAEERGRPVPPKQLFSGEACRILTPGGWAGVCGAIHVTVSQPNEALSAGQIISVVGMISRPAPAMNPGEFDRSQYDRRQRLLATMHVLHPYNIRIIGSGMSSLETGIRSVARGLLANGFDPGRQLDRALLQALVFGEREPILRGVEEQFQRSGTAHVLASNGARTAMLAAFLYLACRLLRVGPRKTVLIVAGAVGVYGLAAVPSPQAVRPALLCIAVGVGLAGRRTADSVQLLALAALTILVFNPLDVYSAGFQLSFVTVLGMIVLTRPALELLEKLEDPDQRVLASFGRQSAMQSLRQSLLRVLARALAGAIIAWLVSWPLVAYHFEQVNPWTVPASLALSPLAFASLAAGILKVLLTAAVPPMAHAWAVIASLPAGLLRRAVGLAARLPASDVPLSQPPLWAEWTYYLLLAMLPLARWFKPRFRWCLRLGPVGACALVLLSPGLFGFARQSGSQGGVRITLLSVGAGQCAVVEPPDGRVFLIDDGSSTIADVMREVLGPFLRHEGRGHIDRIFLSHGDYDHISATEAAVSEYGVDEVDVSPHFRRHAPESAPCAHLLAMLDRTGHSPRLIVSGEKLDVGGGASVQVLWPPAHCNFNSNNTGLVLRLCFAGKSVLFPADIQEPAESALLRHPAALRSDVLVAPHHGSREGTTADFVNAVDPRVIVSSNAHVLTSKQRAFEQVIDGRLLYRTGRCGAITIVLDKDGGIRVTPFLIGKEALN